MKPEPLKDKRLKIISYEDNCSCRMDKDNKGKYVYIGSIKSAVEWLKEEDTKVYKEIREELKDEDIALSVQISVKLIKLTKNRNKAFEDVIKK